MRRASQHNVELEPESIKRILSHYELVQIVKMALTSGSTRITSPLTAQRLSQSLGIDERFLTFLLETLRRTGLVERTQDNQESWTYQSTPVAQ